MPVPADAGNTDRQTHTYGWKKGRRMGEQREGQVKKKDAEEGGDFCFFSGPHYAKYRSWLA